MRSVLISVNTRNPYRNKTILTRSTPFSDQHIHSDVSPDVFKLNVYFVSFTRFLSSRSLFVSLTSAINKIGKVKQETKTNQLLLQNTVRDPQRLKMMIYSIKLRIYMITFLCHVKHYFSYGTFFSFFIFSRCKLLRCRQNCHRDLKIINENIVEFIKQFHVKSSEIWQIVYLYMSVIFFVFTLVPMYEYL